MLAEQFDTGYGLGGLLVLILVILLIVYLVRQGLRRETTPHR